MPLYKIEYYKKHRSASQRLLRTFVRSDELTFVKPLTRKQLDEMEEKLEKDMKVGTPKPFRIETEVFELNRVEI